MLKIRNPSQHQFVNKMSNGNSNIVIAIGPSGTGKTLLAIHLGVQKLLQNRISKIVLTRPTVSVDEDIGFLPGKIEDKMLPWLRPIFDILQRYFSKDVIQQMLNANVIEMCPLSLMRGRTFEDSWIICDEAQNTTPNQMKMVITRLGKNSKMIIIGDTEQQDGRFSHNGLIDITQRIENQGDAAKNKGIHIIRFSQNDVQRHAVVKYLLDVYEDRNNIEQ
jgi:phosphate starvation-inducible PhoH-like protein